MGATAPSWASIVTIEKAPNTINSNIQKIAIDRFSSAHSGHGHFPYVTYIIKQPKRTNGPTSAI